MKVLLTIYLLIISGNINEFLLLDKYHGTHIISILFSYIIIIYFLYNKRKIDYIYNNFKIPILLFIISPILSLLFGTHALYGYISFLGLISTLIITLFLSIKYDIFFLLKIIINAGIVCFIFSLMLVFLFPDIAIDNKLHIGDWQGIFDHKNILGLFSLLYFSSSLYLFKISKSYINKLWYILNTIFAIILAFNSGSKTTIALMVIIFMMMNILIMNKYIKKNFLPFIIFIIFFIVYFANIKIGNIGTSLDYISFYKHEISLTGRLTIWVFSLSKAMLYPFFGYGYNSFWGVSNEANIIESGLGDFYLGDSHNGFINAILSFGIIGTIIIILLLIKIFLLFYKYYKKNKYNLYSSIYLYLFVLIMLTNLTESTLYKSTNIYQFLLFYIVFRFIYINKFATKKN